MDTDEFETTDGWSLQEVLDEINETYYGHFDLQVSVTVENQSLYVYADSGYGQMVKLPLLREDVERSTACTIADHLLTRVFTEIREFATKRFEELEG